MSNWRAVRLGDLTSKIGSGVTPTGGSEIFTESGVLFIRSQNIKNNLVDTTDNKYIPELIDEKMRNSRVIKNDVLYNITGASIGRSAVFGLAERANVNQHVCILRIKNENPNFIQYALASDVGAKNLWGFQAGGNREGLNFQQLASYKLSLPEKLEQDRIVTVLKTWDECLGVLKTKIALKKKQQKGLTHHLLTGETRLRGFSEEWKAYKLSDLFTVKKGHGLSKDKLSKDGNPCILYGEIYTRYDEVIDSVVSKTSVNEGLRSKINDILIPASTTTSGLDLATAAVLLEDDVLLGGDINVLRPKTVLSGVFVSLLLSSVKKHDLARRAQGITIVHLYGKDILNVSVKLPRYDEQFEIANVMLKLREEINILEARRDYVLLQKKYLLKNLITGAIRTPETLTPKERTYA